MLLGRFGFAIVLVLAVFAAVRTPTAQQTPVKAGAATAPPVANLSTDKTMFWTAAEIESRWEENERLNRTNSRIFNGPTNISANVRIVQPNDPPLVHPTTADLWIVTAGTAVAQTDGTWKEGTPSIVNATTRPVRAGDVLLVPPGVPHHFTDVKGFRAWLIRFDTLGLVRAPNAPPLPPPAASASSASAVPNIPDGRTMFWTAAEIDARWKENETLKRANSRIFNGPANISANVRIVLDNDPPLTHVGTADLWIVTAGQAVARTDGEVFDNNGTPTIRNATVRNVGPGDVLFVPPGVPHHYTDLQGFRAWLIRFDVEGWTQSMQP